METIGSRLYEQAMRTILVTSAIALAGCAVQPPPLDSGRADELAGRIGDRAESCVPIQATANIRVLDSATLAYGFGRTIHINHLRGGCPGLNPQSTLIFDLHASQYCSGDHFRTTDTGATVPGPVCFLGDWVPYSRP